MRFAKHCIQIFFLLIPIAVFAWLIDRNLGLTSSLEASFDFRGSSAMISALKRDDRVRSIAEEGGGYFQTMIGDPVYAEIANPPWPFRSVRVDVKYRIRRQPVFALGIKRGATGSGMDLKPMFSEEADGFLANENNWQWNGADFALADAFRNDQHHLVLIFSAPDIEKNGGTIDVGEIRVRYDRDPLSFQNIFQYIKNRILRYVL